MPAHVTIVVLNWNGRADTLACLESLRAVINDKVTVLVVDNGSIDGSVPAIRAAYPDLEVIETGSNLGYAGGNNIGIERAVAGGADFVWVLNNDTTCAPDAVERLLEAAERQPRAGMLSPRIFYMHEPERVWFDGARWKPGALTFGFPGKDRLESELAADDHETDYACGAALFVRAEIVRQIGAFDPRFFLVWEESDWGFRARQAGWASLVVPSARVWHKVGASFGSEASPLRTYFSARNKLVWLQRHGTAGERIRAYAAAARAAVPRWQVTADGAVPLTRRVLWAAREWSLAAAGRGERLGYLARRRALADFVLGRLGPPPALVLELSRRWSARQGSRTAAAPE